MILARKRQGRVAEFVSKLASEFSLAFDLAHFEELAR
jgi:hypothetical protein